MHYPVAVYRMLILSVGLPLVFVCFLTGCRKSKDTSSGESDKGKKGKTLVGIEISAIHLESMPRYNRGGESWDAWAPGAQNPDPYVRISQLGHPVYTSETSEDHPPEQKVEFVKGIPFTLLTYTTPLLVEIFDEDGMTEDDNMGYFSIDLMEYRKKEAVELVSPDGALRISLEFRWVTE
jgi:hypothetical protein